jgi:hypothetical protein
VVKRNYLQIYGDPQTLDRRVILRVTENAASLEELRAQVGDEFTVRRTRLPCVVFAATLNTF